jgi:ribokinase
MKKTKILTVGSINMDILMYGVPRLAGFGEAISYKNYLLKPGGKGAIQASTLAKFGVDSHLVGTLGKDEYGKVILEELAYHGVDTKHVFVNPDVKTGLASIIIEEEAARYAAYVAQGGNDHVWGEQVEEALQEQFDMVLMQLEMPLETVYRTYELASERGIPVFLDAGPAAKIPLERLKGIFVISPNEAETLALTGIDPVTEEDAIKAARKLYEEVKPQYVILKLGEKGAMLFDGKKVERIPCFDVNAIDTTGAGDTFNAALVVSYCNGNSIVDSIVFAHAAAGLGVMKEGGLNSIPSLESVHQFLK